jgi:hypothetical protein
MRVTRNDQVIEEFLTSGKEVNTKNLSTHSGPDGMTLLRNYGTLIAVRNNKGKVEILDKKFSTTTSRIQNKVEAEANKLGFNVSKVKEFEKGGQLDLFKQPKKMATKKKTTAKRKTATKTTIKAKNKSYGPNSIKRKLAEKEPTKSGILKKKPQTKATESYEVRNDEKRQAMPPGYRRSEKTGNIYYEARANRSDISQKNKKKKLAKGGKVGRPGFDPLSFFKF